MQRLVVCGLLALAASGAFAHGNVSCPAMPKEEKQPQMALQKKLEGEGWRVRQVKNSNGCYEVYGFDGQGKKAEAFFNPKTFERVYAEGEQPAATK
ncbi:MAG: PepSY domain-containing protein [Comamonadaceae bacterium]|nr:PepSY domain-containing protein [Comamonadaceae bacterium]